MAWNRLAASATLPARAVVSAAAQVASSWLRAFNATVAALS